MFIAQVARLDQLPEDQRLDPERVVADIAAMGKPSFYEPTSDDIVEKLKPLVNSVMSSSSSATAASTAFIRSCSKVVGARGGWRFPRSASESNRLEATLRRRRLFLNAHSAQPPRSEFYGDDNASLLQPKRIRWRSLAGPQL